MLVIERQLAARPARIMLTGNAPTPSLFLGSQQQSLGAIMGVRCLSSSSSAAMVRTNMSGAWRRSYQSARRGPRSFNRLGLQQRFNSNFAPQVNAAAATLPPPRRSFIVRLLATVGLFCVFTPLGMYLGAGPQIQTLREMENAPSDAETLSLVDPALDDPAHEINENIINHPLAKELGANPKFTAARPHMKIPPSLRQHNFTAGTLLGPNMMPVAPLVFATDDGTECVQMLYLGPSLCGHPGLVHGGMLATLLDEGLARCCFPGLPNKVAVTASLKVDYRKPCKAGQYVVLKAVTTKFEGRKAWVTGRLETLPLDGSPGDLLVEAEALFIEPRNAALLARQRSLVAGDSK